MFKKIFYFIAGFITGAYVVYSKKAEIEQKEFFGLLVEVFKSVAFKAKKSLEKFRNEIQKSEKELKDSIAAKTAFSAGKSFLKNLPFKK